MPSKRRTFISITILIFLTIGMHYAGWLTYVEDFLRRSISPASSAMYALSVDIGGNKEEFKSIDDLKNAYQEAMSAVLSNQIDATKQKLLEQENSELRTQLNFLQKMDLKQIGGEVIGKNVDPLGNTLILNRGVVDGVKINDPVIVQDGVIIGKIARTEERISILRLINDNQSRLAVTIINQEKSLGLVEGGYGISVQMNYIPQNEAVSVGDLIVTSGLEENMPRGLLIGTVETVEKEAYQPFQKAIVKPMVNLEKVRLVSVLLTN